MATLVKEKRKEKKKKPKEINNIGSTSAHDLQVSEDLEFQVKFNTSEPNEESVVSQTSVDTLTDKTDDNETKIEVLDQQPLTSAEEVTNNALGNTATTVQEEKTLQNISEGTRHVDNPVIINKTLSDVKETQLEEKTINFQRLNTKLDIINMQYEPTLITATENIEKELVSTVDSLNITAPQTIESANLIIEDTHPSAPVFDFEEPIPQVIQQQAVQEQDLSPKLKSMPLEEALRLYGGMTLLEVRAMSEREELNVEAGPDCGPEHPLVDLLLTFRQSLASVERERIKLAQTYKDAERYRETLWKIEKRPITASEKCNCGATVEFRGTYESAELMKNRLPIAKMKLKGLLNDAQDCYCHHQHAALLAHYQIEEFIAHTSQSSKKEIRTALSLLLQELRVSGSEADVLNASLQRWARELAASLVDARDMRQLLFLLHHLFRQTRSVHWAAPFISLPANDSVDVARILATIELILCGKTIDTATECSEVLDTSFSEVWEEVDKSGSCAAVSDGAMRERDLMGLIRALPLQEVVKRLALFRGRDTQTRDEMWIDKTGGHGVIKVICGARWLIAVLLRGLSRHPHYSGLATHLGGLADLTVQTIADLHLHNSPHYQLQLVPKVTAELEELFSASFALVSRCRLCLTRLPYRMLTERAAMAYCMGFMIGLHDSIDKTIDGVDATIPGGMSCGQRVKVLSQMAVDRHNDHDLARNVIEFMFQTGIKRKTTPCKGDCESTSRQCLSDVLSVHTYMYPTALYIMADFYEADHTDISSLKYLQMEIWRPVPQELLAVLADWKKRCLKLLPHLLLGLDYSPKGGVSLQSQETLLWWLLEESSVGEWRWEVALRSWTHRVWRGDGGNLTHVERDDLFGHMYNLLVTEYGHSVPLICEAGVQSLITLCTAGRVKETIHCLNPMLISLAQSPESISFTPKFKELVSLLIASGPTLVQRALGRGRDSGMELLHRLLVSHLTGKQMFCDVTPSAVCATWLHLICASETATLAETAVCATRDWTCLDHFVRFIIQDNNSQTRWRTLLTSSARCPTVVEAVLRARSRDQQDTVARLGDVLYRQRLNKDRIHVDNGLQSIGADISSEELVIHQCAAAALVAPVTNPSHLTLWRTFIHLYLQRPQCDMRESTHPLGPLYFSGIIKSRVLAQLKKRLTETANHHQNEAEQLKYDIKTIQKPKTEKENRVQAKKDRDREFIPKLSMSQLTGESSESDKSDEELEVEMQIENEEDSCRDMMHMLCYHEAAEKLVKTYVGWLEQGDTVLAMHHQADITRFIPQQAMEVAWKRCLEKSTPSTADDELSPKISKIESNLPRTPLQRAVDRITRYKPGRRRKSRQRSIMSPIDEIKSTDKRSLLILLDKRLKQLEALAEEWEGELSRVCVLDEYVCDLVRGLRAPVPLRPVKKACSNNCRPITINLQVQEWCVDTRAENAIKENRASALSALRKLIRARPHVAETAAAIQTIARHVMDCETAYSLLVRGWTSTSSPGVDTCPSVKDALHALFTHLAQRWISPNGVLSSQLITKFCSSGVSSRSIRNKLVATLVSPTAVPWYPLYTAILNGQLPPDAAFSFLSKFEMSRLSDTISTSERKDLFDMLLLVVQTYNSRTEPEYQMLNELLLVHISNVIDAPFFPYVCSKCCNAAVACTIPPALFTHLHSALNRCMGQVGFNELGHSLRNIGEVWWSVRTNRQSDKDYSDYSTHIATLISTAVRGLAIAAQQLSYSEERVSWCTWSGLLEGISPWVSVRPPVAPPDPSLSPRTPAPLLVSPNSPLHLQLVRGVGNLLRHLINDAGLKSLLQHVWEYCVQQICTVERPSSECSDLDRIQLSNVLAEVTDLPWEEDWFTVKCMPGLVQLCNISSTTSRQWCMVCVRSVTPEQWMCQMTSQHLIQHLATLLYVTTTLPLFEQTINNICLLPWYQLPMSVLEQSLDQFYGEHYSTTVPYHTLPQFRIILYASELQWDISTNDTAIYLRPGASEKRICSVSFWIRVTSAPALQGHVADSMKMLLDIVTELAVYLDPESVELDSLLGRAISILYTEPAAAASLPVWLKFVSTSTALVLRSCISAVARFTSIEYFGTLSDEIIKAYMRHSEPTSWRAIYSRWRDCLWSSSKEFCKRGRLHTAYGVIDRTGDVREAINVLTAIENYDFVENEVICAVWICVACRHNEVAVLNQWGEEPKLNILRTITLHNNRDRPTAKLRFLCRFALCVLSPNSEPAQRSYEAACTTVLGSNPGDVITWAKQPSMRRLVELAIKLYPKYDNYFEMEVEKVQVVTE